MSARTPMRGFAVALGLALLVGTAPVEAQNRDRRGGDRQEMEERFRRQMSRMIQERLRLDEAEAAEVFGVMRQFDRERRELGRSEAALRRRVEALLIEAGDEPVAGVDVEARELLDRMSELRLEEHELATREQEALGELLSPLQLLRLNELRQQVARRIRSLRGDRRRGGDPGGVPGHFRPGWVPIG